MILGLYFYITIFIEQAGHNVEITFNVGFYIVVHIEYSHIFVVEEKGKSVLGTKASTSTSSISTLRSQPREYVPTIETTYD